MGLAGLFLSAQKSLKVKIVHFPKLCLINL